MTSKRYCIYCGRVVHRCDCHLADSRLQQFLRRNGQGSYQPAQRDRPYKRGVPPQIKRRERTTLQKHYAAWYAQLVDDYGEQCLHCGATEHLVIDHIIPLAKGGLSIYDNLQLLCRDCNSLKGKLVFDCR